MRGLLFNNRNSATPALASISSINTHQQHLYRELQHHRSSNTMKTSQSRTVMYSRDWRSALRTPPTYRIGNRTVRFNYHIALILVGVFTLFILFYYMRLSSSSSSDAAWLKNYASSTSNHRSSGIIDISNNIIVEELSSYNSTYPLTPPINIRPGVLNFRIAMVADLDINAKVASTSTSINTVWRSYFKKGHLTYVTGNDDIKITWDTGEPKVLESSFSLKERGMELSELVTFNGKLLTFDDRTGLIYELSNDKATPWIILLDGNGHNTKGFKSEWAAVKDRVLYVGSMGKEWTTGSGEYENDNPMFIKAITTAGTVSSIDWSYNYKRLRQEAADIVWPGYMIHESGVWSSVHKKWFFLPRRCSKERYNETRDEYMGCNLLITADDNFTKVETIPLDASNTQPTHGVSSFKFIPFTDDRIIVALRSQELNGKTTTFITAFDINGKTLLPEQQIVSEYKYEGFEFI
uniref:Apyrase n=1 Tax=Glossina brevipalpis TaxID=37001 RepID=A0A1A9X0H4_9MUSC